MSMSMSNGLLAFVFPRLRRPHSIPTGRQIAHLVDDLAAEKRSHKAARESLEIALRAVEAQSVCLQEKDQEAEQHSMRLAELDQASAAVQDENLELLRRIQEMNNRLAEEQKAAAVAAESPEGEAGGGGLRKELKKLQQAVEMNACLLEAVKRQVRTLRCSVCSPEGLCRSW